MRPGATTINIIIVSKLKLANHPLNFFFLWKTLPLSLICNPMVFFSMGEKEVTLTSQEWQEALSLSLDVCHGWGRQAGCHRR